MKRDSMEWYMYLILFFAGMGISRSLTFINDVRKG